ncbi:MAG: methionine adenosyltransferase [Candidatus Altiarchaeales archaeon]|nr:methionine adenosyltransferase [Candidatus Altiarchaeales archaeon]MBD3415606.1 methionine adenosyltransferase [Candidatus Altiarchaeales archaeon]
MRNIYVEFPNERPLDKQDVELVERKGIGHPDSICDGLAEGVSRALSQEYVKRFGHILHHNTDQVELVGGRSTPEWGAGEIDTPMYILLSGRATTQVGDDVIPVGEIAIEAARKYLKENFRNIDVDTSVILDQKIGMGSSDLRSVFGRKGIPKANDTSFGVSFAPFSLTEQLTYEVERYMNGTMKKKVKASGEDIKVMGERYKDEIILTICNGMVSKHIKNIGDYKAIIEEMTGLVRDFVAGITDKDVRIEINTGDDIDNQSVFLTVSGTSAEMGDDGSVGRGNRANGLITPYRPMSLEATAGKNPVNHVGKLYNLLSKEIACEIACEGADQVYVRLLSQIGHPIDQPLCADVQVVGPMKLEKRAVEITDYWLENIQEMTEKCLKGKAETF